MSGIKCDLRNLSKSFEKLKSIDAADQRKLNVIAELRNAFMRQGYSPVMAQHMAEVKYKSIHKI